MNTVFHMSLPCKNIKKTKEFYSQDLGFEIGRETDKWIDINIHKNQLTFVLVEDFNFEYPNYSLENETLPTFHFGLVLDNESWDEIYDAINRWSVDAIIKKTFFEEKNGEHNSFFVQDPNGYYVEFKTFKEHNEIFM